MLGPGALVWAGFDGEQAPGDLLDGIRDGRVGGVILFAIRGNIRSKQQVREMLREIQMAARHGGLPPVPVAVDQEGGQVVRIGYRAVFPSAMAIAATGDASYAERAARAVAVGLRADGVGVNFAPVCDVNSVLQNPVIGTRAFGDDPARVAEFAAAWVRGSEAERVASTAKHFPGHGETRLDSHHSLVDVAADRETIERRDLAPFRAAFAAGASVVMTAHVRYAALDPAAPATISRPILTDLLRTTLGFTGLCVTDALDMRGIVEFDSAERIVGRAVEAGVDAVMMTGSGQLEAAEWIRRTVSRARIDEALDRAAAFRDRFALEVPDGDVDDEHARALASEIAARAITRIGAPLPRLDGRVRFVAFEPSRASPVEELADPVGALERALRARFRDRMSFTRHGVPAEGDGPCVVFTFNAFFDGTQSRAIPDLLGRDGVLVALRSPYDAVLAGGRPALLSYGDVPASLDAVAAVLAGERQAAGTLPVRLS